MKKLLLYLMVLISSSLFYSEKILANEKIKSVYFCNEENKFLKKECSHLNKKRCLQYNQIILKSEFEKNEPRALKKFGGMKNLFIIKGEIKKLDSGVLDDSYIIRLKDGTDVYIDIKQKGQEDLYYELNNGDEVYLLCGNLHMVWNDLVFDGIIISERKFLEIYNAING